MTKKIEYLVKYSVAPPPSRDYYGLKVFQDEVILYLWRISHGPHKAPIAHRAKFAEFSQEKSLQHEIRRGFGKYLLKYVENIAEGNRNTLLTLPKSLIGRISRYLKFTDVVKLSSLSHIAYEVFNTDSVWQILYKRDKKARISLEEKEEARVYGWKQLYKDRQMQTSIKHQRNLRIPSSIKVTNDTKTNKGSMRPTCDSTKPVSKITSSISITTKKHSEFPSTNFVTMPLSKDSRSRVHTENEKSLSQKRNAKSVNSAFKVNEKNAKKEDPVTSKTTARRQTKNIPKCDEVSNKQQNKPRKYSNKIDNIKAKPIISTQESKSTSVISKSSVSENIVGNVKSSSSLTQNWHSKTRSKTKSKPKKKAVTTESEIFSTDKTLSENSFVDGDSNFDLADLIEASVKNIRSPRSIFDYDFSCIQQSDVTKDASKIKNEIENIDKLKQLKLTQSSVTTNNFSEKMIRSNDTLEKLSEKSEPFSGTSNESLVNDKISSPERNDKSFISEKYMKAIAQHRAAMLKTIDWKARIDPMPHPFDQYLDVNFRNKSLDPKNIDNNDEKFPIARGPLKTSSLLKAYASNSLESRKDLPADPLEEKINILRRRLV